MTHPPPPPTERCPVCHKRVYRSWAHAAFDAREMRRKRTSQRGEEPYWSRRCQCIHVGRKRPKTGATGRGTSRSRPEGASR